MSIDRDSAGHKGAVLHQLSGSGLTQSKGTLILNDSDRRDLLAGRLALVIYTANQPAGTVKGPIVAASGK
jgi:hypothetical protein